MHTEILIAIIASSGLWGLIQFLINRKDSIGEKIDKLTELVREVSDRVDASSATNARTVTIDKHFATYKQHYIHQRLNV